MKDPDDRFQNARDLKYNLGLAVKTTAVAASQGAGAACD